MQRNQPGTYWPPYVAIAVLVLMAFSLAYSSYEEGYLSAQRRDAAILRLVASSTVQEFEAYNCQRVNLEDELHLCENGKPLQPYERCVY